MRREEGHERVGADLLLALDEDGQVHGQVVAEHAGGAQVGHDAGLVVGRAAAVERARPVGALGRLEGRGVPLGVVVLGLHVVVGVEQHGRRLGVRAALVGDHGRRAAGLGEDLGLEALGGEQRAHGLGAALHLARPLRVGAHRLDAHQVLEVAAYAGEDCLDAVTEVVAAHGATLGPPTTAQLVGRDWSSEDR